MKWNEYDISVLGFEKPPTEGKKKSFNSMFFPTYGGNRCPFMQLPSITLDMYGIPNRGEFYKDDSQRMFIKIPVSKSPAETIALTMVLTAIDKKFGSDKMKEQLFGKNSKYSYQPIVRYPLDEDGNPHKGRHPYIKVKLATSYTGGDILTTITKKEKDDKKTILTDTQNIDEFSKHVCWNSKIKCIVSLCKIWVGPTNVPEPSYGITLKLMKVLLEEPPKSAIANFINDETAFIDSDED